MQSQMFVLGLFCTWVLLFRFSNQSTASVKADHLHESGKKNLSMVPDNDHDEGVVEKRRIVNFASVTAGAVVLESSPQSVGFHNLLSDDKDKYGISPCSEKKWLVIGLSEDIMVTSIVMANFEKFSSKLKEFQLLGSTSYPVSQWLDLGTYMAQPKWGEQIFNLTNPSFVRYLKFRFLTHYGDEYFCTLSQIRVHGSTVIESMQSEFELSNEEIRKIHNIINADDLQSRMAHEEEPVVAKNTNSNLDHNDHTQQITGNGNLDTLSPEGNSDSKDSSQENPKVEAVIQHEHIKDAMNTTTTDSNNSQTLETSNELAFDISVVSSIDPSQLKRENESPVSIEVYADTFVEISKSTNVTDVFIEGQTSKSQVMANAANLTISNNQPDESSQAISVPNQISDVEVAIESTASEGSTDSLLNSADTINIVTNAAETARVEIVTLLTPHSASEVQSTLPGNKVDDTKAATLVQSGSDSLHTSVDHQSVVLSQQQDESTSSSSPSVSSFGGGGDSEVVSEYPDKEKESPGDNASPGDLASPGVTSAVTNNSMEKNLEEDVVSTHRESSSRASIITENVDENNQGTGASLSAPDTNTSIAATSQHEDVRVEDSSKTSEMTNSTDEGSSLASVVEYVKGSIESLVSLTANSLSSSIASSISSLSEFSEQSAPVDKEDCESSSGVRSGTPDSNDVVPSVAVVDERSAENPKTEPIRTIPDDDGKRPNGEGADVAFNRSGLSPAIDDSIRSERNGSSGEPQNVVEDASLSGDKLKPIAMEIGADAGFQELSSANETASATKEPEESTAKVVVGSDSQPPSNSSAQGSVVKGAVPSAESKLTTRTTNTDQTGDQSSTKPGSGVVSSTTTTTAAAVSASSSSSQQSSNNQTKDPSTPSASTSLSDKLPSEKTIPPSLASKLHLQCIDSLRFADFQAKIMQKRQVASDSDRAPGVTQQEFVIRTLIQKITTLEFNFAILETYSSQVSDCYRIVFHELMNVTSELHTLQALHKLGGYSSSNKDMTSPVVPELIHEHLDSQSPVTVISDTRTYEIHNVPEEKYILVVATIAIILAVVSILFSTFLTCLLLKTIRNSS